MAFPSVERMSDDRLVAGIVLQSMVELDSDLLVFLEPLEFLGLSKLVTEQARLHAISIAIYHAYAE